MEIPDIPGGKNGNLKWEDLSRMGFAMFDEF